MEDCFVEKATATVNIATLANADSRLAHPSIELAVEDGDSVKPRA